MRYLVSLVGELVIPNLLAAKTLPSIDRHLFIRPRRLANEGSVERICSLCGIRDPELLEVEEFSLADIDRALESFLRGREAEYVVNLTAGSRVMALAAFDAFRGQKSQILYLPPGTNVMQQLWPAHSEAELPITCRLTREEYLAAHGVSCEDGRGERHPEAQLETMFRLITQNSNGQFMGRLNRLGSETNSPRLLQQQEATARLFARELGVRAEELYDPRWLSFLKGAWFEEYFAAWVDRVLGSGVAAHGLKVEKDGVDNELDSVFTWENRLYIGELKASASLGAVNEFLYKLDSVGKDFGLMPRCFLVIADPDVERGLEYSPHLRYRAERMGIGIITYSQLRPEKIERTIRGMTGLGKQP